MSGPFDVTTIEVGMLGTNCYLVQDRDTHKGYIVDPGADARRVIETCRKLDLKVKGILCTHGHVDHVGAVGKVAAEMGASVYISREDSGIISGSAHGINRLGSILVSKPDGVEFIKGGDVMSFGERTLKVMRTPGHTPGSLSFLCEENLFCGDLVFQGSIGRTDLKGGSFQELLDSVRREVWVLPPSTKIFPGHGPSTTVQIEMAGNPFLRDLEPER